MTPLDASTAPDALPSLDVRPLSGSIGAVIQVLDVRDLGAAHRAIPRVTLRGDEPR